MERPVVTFFEEHLRGQPNGIAATGNREARCLQCGLQIQPPRACAITADSNCQKRRATGVTSRRARSSSRKVTLSFSSLSESRNRVMTFWLFRYL